MALLRGVNVGGNRKVPMADLRDVIAGLGYDDVSTYIQSGNVVFSTSDARGGIESTIESAIAARFGFPVPVVVRSARQLRTVVHGAPPCFGQRPETYYSDVIFLKAPLTAARALAVTERRDGVDEAWAGMGVLYYQRLGAERTKSKLGKIAATPEYQLLTIRNWTTTTKLLALLGASR